MNEFACPCGYRVVGSLRGILAASDRHKEEGCLRPKLDLDLEGAIGAALAEVNKKFNEKIRGIWR